MAKHDRHTKYFAHTDLTHRGHCSQNWPDTHSIQLTDKADGHMTLLTQLTWHWHTHVTTHRLTWHIQDIIHRDRPDAHSTLLTQLTWHTDLTQSEHYWPDAHNWSDTYRTLLTNWFDANTTDTTDLTLTVYCSLIWDMRDTTHTNWPDIHRTLIAQLTWHTNLTLLAQLTWDIQNTTHKLAWGTQNNTDTTDLTHTHSKLLTDCKLLHTQDTANKPQSSSNAVNNTYTLNMYHRTLLHTVNGTHKTLLTH
jgi:hypothetical protein